MCRQVPSNNDHHRRRIYTVVLHNSWRRRAPVIRCQRFSIFFFVLCPFRSTSMLMFGHLLRKTQANDLNDDLDFSRSCRKLLDAIIMLCYGCAHVAHLYIAKIHPELPSLPIWQEISRFFYVIMKISRPPDLE